MNAPIRVANPNLQRPVARPCACLLLALSATTMSSCHHERPAAQEPQPTRRGQDSQEAVGSSAERVVSWALGQDTRRPLAPRNVHAHVLWHLARTPASSARQVTPECVEASSLLPTPDGSHVLLVIDGALHTLSGDPEKTEAPRAITVDPPLRIDRLLAFGKHKNALVALATGRRAGQRMNSIWQIDIGRLDGAKSKPAIARTWLDTGVLSSIESFLARYVIPRCLLGKRDCLVVTQVEGRGYLDAEASRGGTREPDAAFEGVDVRDAAWAQASAAQARWLLVACQR